MINDHSELLAAIRALQDKLLSENEQKKFDELCALERWMINYSTYIVLPYPFYSIDPQEKSDFLLRGNTTVGIEIRRFLAEQLGRAENIAANPNDGFFPGPFNFDSPKRKNPIIEDIVTRPPCGLSDFRNMDFDANMYADQIIDIISKKVELVIVNASTPCNRYILIIEDWHRISNTTRADISHLVGPRIDAVLQHKHSFDEIWFTSLIPTDKAILWRKNSQQAGAGYPPQGVGSPDP